MRYGPEDLKTKHSLYKKCKSSFEPTKRAASKVKIYKKHYRMYGIELYVTRGRSLVLMENYAQEKSAAS